MDTMRAAVVDQAGPPEVFRVVDLPVPTATASEIIVRQSLAGVNFGDVIRRKRGLFPLDVPPPYVLGFEGVGTIESVGPAVTDRRVGERVAYLTDRGGYGECVAVPSTQAWTVPFGVPDEAVAGMTVVGLTAWGLIEQSGVRPGDVAVVHGAAGGVGSVLIQLLASQGVRAIGVVTGREKSLFVAQMGAELTFDRAKDNVESEIKGRWPAGVDVVFDCVGQDVLSLNLAVIKPAGVWMYYGSTSGHPQFPGDRVLMNRLAIRGFVVFDFARDPDAWKEGTAFFSSALSRGSLKPQSTQVLPLEQVGEAHRRLEARAVIGKMLLSFH